MKEKEKTMSNHSKEQLIEILTPHLVKSTGSAPDDVRQVLETYTIEGLNKELARQRREGTPQQDSSSEQVILDAIRAEAQRQAASDPERIRQQRAHERQMEETLRTYALAQIFRTQILIGGKPHVAVQNKASENIIINWLHPGETLTPDWFRKVFQENPTLANQLQWEEVLDSQTKQQRLQQDRDTFTNQVCRQFQVADTESNFRLVCELVGKGLSKKLNNFDPGAFHQLQQAADSGALARPSQAEIEKWRAEAAEERKDFLVNRATPDQLKAAAREESAARQQAVKHEQARLQLEAQQQRESAMGFPPLPSDITRERIRAASPSEIKVWMKRYGNYQLNTRLAGKG
jgi:hypothetical protein